MTSPFRRYESGEPLTEELFKEMCKAHDLTYTFSDDSRYYNAGRHTSSLIQRAAEELGHSIAFPIWNSVVDEKLVNGARDSFYWRAG